MSRQYVQIRWPIKIGEDFLKVFRCELIEVDLVGREYRRLPRRVGKALLDGRAEAIDEQGRHVTAVQRGKKFYLRVKEERCCETK